MNSQTNTCQYNGCKLPIHHPDGTYCLGHASIENKIVDNAEFNRFIRQNLRGNFRNFDGYIFPTADFIDSREFGGFMEELSFRNCKFLCSEQTENKIYSLSISNINFRKKIDFSGSEFFGSVIFNKNQFHKSLILNNIAIRGEFIIREGTYSQIECKKSVFEDKFLFDPDAIHGNLSFENCQFKESVELNELDFTKGCNFNYSHFHGELNLNASIFSKTATFSVCKFEKEVNFEKAQFNEECLINNSQFKLQADFSNCKFLREAQFCFTSFNLNAIFDNSIFEDDSLWLESKFQRTHFKDVEFRGLVDFSKVEFNNATYFIRTRFIKEAIFNEVRYLLKKTSISNFLPTIYYSNTLFNASTSFLDIVVSGNVIFENINLSDHTVLNFKSINIIKASRIEFHNISFIPFGAFFENIRMSPYNRMLPSVILFRNCNLKDVYFTNNQMSLFSFYKSVYDNARFISSKWQISSEKPSISLAKRKNVIFEDELFNKIRNKSRERINRIKQLYHLSDLDSFEEIANLYRRFKVALDTTKDYEQAGLFYFNEFEMKRIDAKGKSKPKYILYSLYKIYAGYGEKPLRSFFWFLIFICFFSILNMFTGIIITSDKIINYRLLFSNDGVVTIFSADFWTDLAYSFLFTIYRIVPIGYLHVENGQFLPIGLDGYFIAFFNTGILILFITFIAVGLKRIFKRF